MVENVQILSTLTSPRPRFPVGPQARDMRGRRRRLRVGRHHHHKEETAMKAIICFGMLAMLAGCDTSKVELESAKTNLMNVTRERDDLKVQLATLQQQLSTTRSDLEKEKLAAAQATTGKTNSAGPKAAMAAKGGATDGATPGKKKSAHKS
jgi:hypothetical protein